MINVPAALRDSVRRARFTRPGAAGEPLRRQRDSAGFYRRQWNGRPTHRSNRSTARNLLVTSSAATL
jgi:hypothetical protein